MLRSAPELIRRIYLTLGASTLIFSGAVSASESGVLTAEISGVRSSLGTVVGSLCKERQVFPSGCSIKVTAKATKGTTILTFTELPKGKYALALFHDEDNNGKLTFIREGIGFSNGANLSATAPKFEPSSFAVDGKTYIRVKLKYFD